MWCLRWRSETYLLAIKFPFCIYKCTSHSSHWHLIILVRMGLTHHSNIVSLTSWCRPNQILSLTINNTKGVTLPSLFRWQIEDKAMSAFTLCGNSVNIRWYIYDLQSEYIFTQQIKHCSAISFCPRNPHVWRTHTPRDNGIKLQTK